MGRATAGQPTLAPLDEAVGGGVTPGPAGAGAVPTDATVRNPVDRSRFEGVWLSASSGLAYVIRPAGTPLPPAPAQANW